MDVTSIYEVSPSERLGLLVTGSFFIFDAIPERLSWSTNFEMVKFVTDVKVNGVYSIYLSFLFGGWVG